MAICIRSGQVSEDDVHKLWEGKLYIGHSLVLLIFSVRKLIINNKIAEI